MKLAVFSLLYLLKLSTSVPHYEYEIPFAPGILVWQFSKDGEPEKLQYNPNAKFNKNKTYIFAWLGSNLQCQIIYWVGGKSIMEARQQTVIHVGFVLHAVENLKFCLNISIIRETYSKETTTFRALLQSSPQKIPRLYKIVPALLPDRFIVQVPLNIDQIDYNFSYIFEEKSLMTVWHGEGANNFKRGMSESLAKIIVQEDEKPILIIDRALKKIKELNLTSDGEFSTKFLVKQEEEEEDPNNSKQYVNTQKEGIHVTSASSSNSKTVHILDSELSDETREKFYQAFNLYEKEFFRKITPETKVMETEKINETEGSSKGRRKEKWMQPAVYKYYFQPGTNIVRYDREEEVLKHSNLLNTENVYAIKNYFSSEVLVYIGKNAHISLIQGTLEYAETAILDLPASDSWKRITIVQEESAPPLHFQISFCDKCSDLYNTLKKEFLKT